MIDETLLAFGTERCSAILRTHDSGLARDAMLAALRAGFAIVEFTLTIPGALDLIDDFARREGLIVGAGTVLTAEQARQAVDAGARFLVSPVCDAEVIAACHELGVVAIPGTSTPTEMWNAHRLGAHIVKLFPAVDKDPSYVRSCLGPMPELRIFPTSGVTKDNAREYLRAGAFGLGFVAPLFDPELMAEQDFAGIEQRGRELLSLVRNS